VIRRTFLLREDQDIALRQRADGFTSVAAHVRRALDRYLGLQPVDKPAKKNRRKK
jgi:hypothetical protein